MKPIPKWFERLMLIGAAACLLLLIMLLLSSCRSVRKSSSSNSTVTDISAITVSDTSSNATKDSTAVNRTEKADTRLTENSQASGLTIQFGKQDTGRPAATPVVIRQDTDGSFIIDPGGRKIESITKTDASTKKRSRLATESAGDSARVITTQQTRGKDSTAAGLHREQKASASSVTRKGTTIWLYLTAGAIVALFLWLWLTGRLKRKPEAPQAPYSAPNDKTV